MSVEQIKPHRQPGVFDGWKSISIALYMTLVGYGVLVGIPVISTAWVNLLGFTEVQVGKVAGADLGGLSIGAVVASLIITRINRRVLVLIAAGLAISANGLCMFTVNYEQVLYLRLLAGFGSGVYTSVAVASLGASAKPARAFNMMLFAFAFSQALEMQILPQLSMNGIYMVFIGCFAFSLFFLSWVPARAVEKGLDVEVDIEDDKGKHYLAHRNVPTYIPWLVLLAIVFTYINIGAYWTYIELASADSAISDASPEWVGRVLVWASFLSIAGCLFATVLSNRFGLARPLLITLITQSIIVSMLAMGITNTNILISVFMFNFLWIFIDVYQMSTIANVDHSGKFASLIVGAQGLGQILGPNAAAMILTAGFGYRGVFIMCACATLTGMCIYAYMYIMLRKTIPALADAS